MKSEQLQQIIKDKNEQRERSVLRTAEELIEGIVREQQRIAEANAQIDNYRKQLTMLEVQELNASTVLGE